MSNNSQTHKYQEEVGAYFDLFAEKHMDKGDQNPILTNMRNSFRSFIQHPAPKTILDIGCGPGQDVAYLASTYPAAKVYGIDVSAGMIRCGEELAKKLNLSNVQFINTGIEELEQHLAAGTKFDVITVFFGALNTVSSLQQSAHIIERLLNPGGIAMLSFVNKYYLSEFFINIAKGKIKNATARWGETWRGYSPEVRLESKTYTPSYIQKAFAGLKLQHKKGYSVFYPAWFQSGWLKRFPGLCKILYKMDRIVNSTPLWKYGEYTMFVYRKN
jgi:ubiquinone/menaquinone biosynthesis C-methylase UbiE